ncbi:Putative LOC100877443, partial [Caligus rogercresseyi]
PRTLGISFRGPAAPRVSSFLKHESLLEIPKAWDRLGLSECLSAFSEKEVLDENNPWFCSSCQKNQCATKTLTIWRAPDFLIIYLKRY